MDEVWKMLKASLPEFTLPELPQDPSVDPSTGLVSMHLATPFSASNVLPVSH